MNLRETVENRLITLINEDDNNLEEIEVLTELLKTVKETSTTYINTPNIDNTSIPKYKPTPYWYNNSITCEKK